MVQSNWIENSNHIPLPVTVSPAAEGAADGPSAADDGVRFLPKIERINMSWTSSWRTKKCHKRLLGADDPWIGLNGVLPFSSNDRYLWMAGPLASLSMKHPGMKSNGAGPRRANSSFNISCHIFNVRNTPCVNGLATGNSETIRNAIGQRFAGNFHIKLMMTYLVFRCLPPQ